MNFCVLCILLLITLHVESFSTYAINTFGKCPLKRSYLQPNYLHMNFADSGFRKYVIKFGVAVALIGAATQPAFADQSFQEQLKVIQALQLKEQVKTLEDQQQSELTRGVKYEVGQLIAKGVITIPPIGPGVDTTQYPLGLPDAVSLDPEYGNDGATLYLTAVGREGPPVAAKRYKLKDIKFPLVFEITTEDLFFPYTQDAWQKSPLSADSIAVTAILDADGDLLSPSDHDRFGFSISDPASLGGSFQRTEAKINVNLKSDGRAYTPEEIELLTRVEREVKRIEESKATVLASSSSTLKSKK